MHRLLLMAALLASALPSAEPWQFAPRHIDEKLAGCDDPKDGCAHAEFTFVEAVGGPPGARESVNQAIREALVARPADSLKLTPEEYARHFVDGYRQLPPEDKSFAHRWTLSKTVKVIRTAPPYLCIEYSEASYTGGAHGNFATIYFVFDSGTGGRLTIDQVIKPDLMPRAAAIAEAHFRADRKLSPTADLKAAGFWFPDGRFQLTGNFGITGSELIFHYNTYEIAPYSTGETTITIPLGDVPGVL